MLTIKRVPTVVSNYQEDADANANADVNDNCCLPFSNIPLYCFKSGRQASEASPSGFFLHGLLLVEWEERMRRGLFRYDVRTCETKVIPGKYGFIAQLNEGRHLKKRPTEFRVDRVLQPFDPAKFNFTKIGQEEALFRFEAAAVGADGDDGSKAGFFKSGPVGGTTNPSIVAINVSPIDYGHVLLIPRVLECLPQRIDHESFLLAVHMAAEAGSPYLRLAYNSLGAFATINHLHFQAYYLAIPFPVENAMRQKISISKGLPDGVTASRPLDFPVRVLVFEGRDNLKELSDLVADSCIWLQENNIPFNVLISDQGRRIFLYPQCYAEKQALGEVSQELLETQVNPAAWEISGHMVLKRREDFEEASEAKAWRLLAEVSLSEERFQEVKAYIY